MSGDWIKMRSNLWDDPRVAKLCDMTNQAEAAVVGALYWLWAAADQHTVDGLLPGLTIRQLDRKTGVLGIGAALLSIGWLTESDAGLAVVKFEEHNGSSAKRRGIEAQRKGLVRKVSASDADKTRTDAGQVAPFLQPIAELEKEKELKHTHTALARDWRLPEPWGQQTLEAYPHWTAETARVIAATFADHHWSAGSTSSDWWAAWRKWCADALTQKAHPPPRATAPAPPRLAAGKATDVAGITVPSKAADQTACYLAEQAARAAGKPPPEVLDLLRLARAVA